MRMKRSLLSLLLALSLCVSLTAPALAAQVKDVDMVISEDGEITFEVECELDAEELVDKAVHREHALPQDGNGHRGA